MTEFWVTTILSFLGGGLSSQVFNWLTTKKQAAVNVDVTISDAWQKYAGKMEERFFEMENKVKLLQEENLSLKKELIVLKGQISK